VVSSEEKVGEKREVRERKARDEWAPEERKQQALEATGTSYVTGRGGEREHTGRCGCHLWRKSHGEEDGGGRSLCRDAKNRRARKQGIDEASDGGGGRLTKQRRRRVMVKDRRKRPEEEVTRRLLKVFKET
jgi:hypothetical protein